MVSTDYRLDHIVARLIERLEGARRSYSGNPDRARSEFRRIASGHVDAAMGEFREVGMADDPDAHEEFVRHEVVETFLPRYQRLAIQMTDLEDAGFRFGVLAEPLGRLFLVGITLVFLFVFGRIAIAFPWFWPILFASLWTPVAPDVAAYLYRASYRRKLEGVVADMGTIQEQATAYLPRERLRVEEPGESAARPQAQPEENP